MTAVGIDAMEIWTGKLKLDLAETFAPAQGDDPGKYTKGLGLRASSFPDVYEDIVTMGANAAHRLMERKGLTPEDIGRIDVATESAFDNSKPVSTYIAGCLEQVYDENFHHANKGERKFACISGTQSLDDATTGSAPDGTAAEPHSSSQLTPHCTPATTPARPRRGPARWRCSSMKIRIWSNSRPNRGTQRRRD